MKHKKKRRRIEDTNIQQSRPSSSSSHSSSITSSQLSKNTTIPPEINTFEDLLKFDGKDESDWIEVKSILIKPEIIHKQILSFMNGHQTYGYIIFGISETSSHKIDITSSKGINFPFRYQIGTSRGPKYLGGKANDMMDYYNQLVKNVVNNVSCSPVNISKEYVKKILTCTLLKSQDKTFLLLRVKQSMYRPLQSKQGGKYFIRYSKESVKNKPKGSNSKREADASSAQMSDSELSIEILKRHRRLKRLLKSGNPIDYKENANAVALSINAVTALDKGEYIKALKKLKAARNSVEGSSRENDLLAVFTSLTLNITKEIEENTPLLMPLYKSYGESELARDCVTMFNMLMEIAKNKYAELLENKGNNKNAIKALKGLLGDIELFESHVKFESRAGFYLLKANVQFSLCKYVFSISDARKPHKKYAKIFGELIKISRLECSSNTKEEAAKLFNQLNPFNPSFFNTRLSKIELQKESQQKGKEKEKQGEKKELT